MAAVISADFVFTQDYTDFDDFLSDFCFKRFWKIIDLPQIFQSLKIKEKIIKIIKISIILSKDNYGQPVYQNRTFIINLLYIINLFLWRCYHGILLAASFFLTARSPMQTSAYV